jgi:hypothetical protein
MFALPPTADIRRCSWNVRKVPLADIHVIDAATLRAPGSCLRCSATLAASGEFGTGTGLRDICRHLHSPSRRLAERSAHPHAHAAGRIREPPASEPGHGHRGSPPGASRALVDRRDPRRIVRCLSLGAEKDRCVARWRDLRGAAGHRGERHTSQRHHRRDRPRPGAGGCNQSAGRIRANGGYEIGWSRLSDRVAGSRPSRQAIRHGGTEEGGY